MSGNFERSVMKKKKNEKKIEKVEDKIIENKLVEEVKINDSICITKTSKIRGQSLYYFSDGSSSSVLSGVCHAQTTSSPAPAPGTL